MNGHHSNWFFLVKEEKTEQAKPLAVKPETAKPATSKPKVSQKATLAKPAPITQNAGPSSSKTITAQFSSDNFLPEIENKRWWQHNYFISGSLKVNEGLMILLFFQMYRFTMSFPRKFGFPAF